MDKVYAYICDGKCKCNTRPDGKKNEYCGTQCKRTFDITHAKYKDYNIFVETPKGVYYQLEKGRSSIYE